VELREQYPPQSRTGGFIKLVGPVLVEAIGGRGN